MDPGTPPVPGPLLVPGASGLNTWLY